MATINGSASYAIIDYLGVRVPKTIYWQASDATTIAQVIADLESFATLLNAVTDGASFAHLASFDVNYVDANLKNTPVEGNPASLNGAASFAVTGTGATYTDVWPAVAQGIIVGGKIDDTPAGAFNNYRTAFTTPFAHLTLTSQDQRTLAAFHSSDIPTRKYRRKQRKVTSGL